MNATRQKLFDAWKKSRAIENELAELIELYKEQYKPLFKAFDRRSKTNLCKLTNEICDDLNTAFKSADRVACGLDIICDELRIGEKDG